MGELDEKVKQAMAVFKAGRKPEAREMLMAVVNQDESHETAWLYLSAMVDTLEEQQICLENVLDINPNNDKARKGLDTLKQKRAAQQKSPPASSPSAAFTSPFPSFDTPAAPPPVSKAPAKPSGGAPIGAEFETTSGDSLIGGAGSPPSLNQGASIQNPFSAFSDDSMDWLTGSSPAAPAAPSSTPDQPDPFAIPTSVDWGNKTGQAAYGSGKQVELPSAQEYDDWVQNLNLSNNAPAAPPFPGTSEAEEPAAAPFDMNAPAPFGDTSFMMDSSPFMMDDAPIAPDSSDGGVFQSSWDTDPEDFGSTEAPAPNSFAAFDRSGTSSPFDMEDDNFPAAEEQAPSMFGASDENDGLSFGFDDKQEQDGGDFGSIWSDEFEEVPSTAAAPSPKASRSSPLTSEVTQEDYFRYIPAEIEAKAGGIASRSLMLLAGIVVLVFLNVASLAFLLL